MSILANGVCIMEPSSEDADFGLISGHSSHLHADMALLTHDGSDWA